MGLLIAMECDGCRKIGPRALTISEAAQLSDQAGWKRVHHVNADGQRERGRFCPACLEGMFSSAEGSAR
jgi:hypothetical protein